jgi:RNA polymerase sigma-70 factor (ECF subfamily)
MAGDVIRRRLVELLPRLRKYALALVAHPADADDLVQSAVLRVLVRPPHEEVSGRLEGFMFTVIRNLWIDEGRKRRVRSAVPLDSVELPGADGRTSSEVRSELQAVRRAFDALSDELREAAALVIVNEMSYREAAEVLGVPIGTIMSRVARARAALARVRATFGEETP